MSDSLSTPSPDQVDPEKLTVLLSDAGWQLVGGRRGAYNRFSPPGQQSSALYGGLIIPLDKSAPDYTDQMSVAIKELASPPHRENWVQVIAPRLSIQTTDRFSFRKESAAPSGLISWPTGEDLITSARQSLLAGAKSYLEPARYFGNRLGQFAKRYLETLLMGQTAPGSYVVTAYAPTDAAVPIKGGPHDGMSFEGVSVATGRYISVSVSKALEATTEAIEHYRGTGSYAAFDDGIALGVSYEMTKALTGMTSNSDGADITIEWDPLASGPQPGESVTFSFRGSDAEVLEKVSTRLVSPEAPRQISVIGRVHLLTRKQAGGPGVVGIETFGSVEPRKLRVRMDSSEDYDQAVLAHREEFAVTMSGMLTREGNLNWLYNAQLDGVLGPIEDLMQWGAPDPPVPPLANQPLFEVLHTESDELGNSSA
ncbi:hypothetical protein [Actinomadura sp. HBU206391]|uniref:hypothetical protein n=1 Tax=Actinomadura sp. HBU206391 TaxID=2731692 RepID=UPI0016507349|nr:hypothetical protein [Actinomadura sp. HBU206391]MBC6461453.1 hypothetical protein [Actinomadura sp. HBU206391]